MLSPRSTLTKLRYAKYYVGVLLRNWKEHRESYAQHGEDLLVERLLGQVDSFIDIGANDGVLFSNTYKFAKMGARGLCFEPSVVTYRKLRLNHLFHPKVKCFRQAVSDRTGQLPFVENGYEAVLSYIGSCENGTATQTVQATTFSEILNRNHRFRKMDLLSVDVEGHEQEVFASLGEAIQARIIIVETDKSDPLGLLELPALREHNPKYHNGVNLILSHHSEQNKLTDLPPGFKSCE
ncbi:FkbM family methyltransferase [Opitutales bacterium]|nr:FkbM family methyltransferase [Opitutales bacterium]